MQPGRLAGTISNAVKLAGVFLLLIVTDGCQERPTTVSGSITIDGRPLTVPADARGTVVFQPDGGHGTMATGLLDSTGHFNLATGSSPEVAEGKYYVTVSVAQLLPKVENEERSAKLITPAKYTSPQESGLEIEVKPGANQVTFDLVTSTDEGNANSPSSSSDASHPDGTLLPKSPTETK
jgi:hypothetical protein